MQLVQYKVMLDEDLHNILVPERVYEYENTNVSGIDDVERLMKDVLKMNKLAEEYVYMLSLNAKGRILGIFEVVHGTVKESILNMREIFIRALLSSATAIIIIHNHPSQDTIPSRNDILITEKMKEASALLGIEFIDHIIIGDDRYSFRENNMI